MALPQRQSADDARRGRWTPLALRAIVLFALLAAGVAAIVASSAVGHWLRPARPGWLTAALTSELSVRCAGAALVSAVVLAMAGTALWRMGAAWRGGTGFRAGGTGFPACGCKGRKDLSGTSGVAMLEFVMVLPMAIAFAMIIVQAGLLMAGNLCVHYAAYCAARAAVVQVPCNLTGEPSNVLAGDVDFGKLQRMRDAAVWAVLPVSAAIQGAPSADASTMQKGLSGLLNSYGTQPPAWLNWQVARRLRYAQDYTKVSVTPSVTGGRYGQHEEVEVTVTHTLFLAVPVANRIFAAGPQGVRLPLGASEWGANVTATCRMTNEGTSDVIDVEHFGS